MKNIMCLMTFILSIWGCYSKTSNISNENWKFVENIDSSIYGTWYFTPYIDSTLKYKMVYDFIFDKKNYVAWYGYMIMLNKDNPDSIIVRGVNSGERQFYIKRIQNNKFLVNSEWFKSFIIINKNGVFVLYLEVSEKLMAENNSKLNTFEFYQKRFTIDREDKYFMKNLFEGVYYNVNDNRKVVIEGQTIKGIDNYYKYDIPIDFVDSYPFDNITLFENNDTIYETFNWRFNGDTLFLNKIDLYYDPSEGDYPSKIEIAENIYKLIKNN